MAQGFGIGSVYSRIVWTDGCVPALGTSLNFPHFVSSYHTYCCKRRCTYYIYIYMYYTCTRIFGRCKTNAEKHVTSIYLPCGFCFVTETCPGLCYAGVDCTDRPTCQIQQIKLKKQVVHRAPLPCFCRLSLFSRVWSFVPQPFGS